MWMWILTVGLCVTIWGEQIASVGGAESLPATTPTVSAVSRTTSAPVVPPALVGSTRVGPAEPPPVRPLIRPTPQGGSAVTFSGVIPRDAKVTIPALTLFGKGEIEISGDLQVRFSGDGSLWVDSASSTTLDPLTTGTKSRQDEGWAWEQFRGTVRITGSSVRLKAKGDRLSVTSEGQGKVQMRGEGMFRITQAGDKLVSGVWTPAGVTEEFATVTTQPAAQVLRPGAVRPPSPVYGVVPDVAPPPKAFHRKSLPSEGGTSVTVREAPAAPAAGGK